MILKVLGSSSKGNCYLLQSEKTGEVLALEAGIALQKVKVALDFNIAALVGCCVTHEHGDHARYATRLAGLHVPMVMSKGTAEHIGLKVYTDALPTRLIKLGGFDILAFDVRHDAVQPVGYLIRHEECGTVLFATDTYYLPTTYRGLNNILIECNYRLDILNNNIAAGLVHPSVRNRIIKSHMSYHTCCEALQANDLSAVNNIILVHLSGDNSHADEFQAGIAALTEKTVLVARPDMTIQLNKTPF